MGEINRKFYAPRQRNTRLYQQYLFVFKQNQILFHIAFGIFRRVTHY